ncbi:predicted protein [Chaetomium globosum CBS 148.51]|uniref:Myb/SANT-like domain-containing protein n=1 Tax=Chaetomium globosum (strain ATCC 6205 / CBS 148.51 / DSM 1962 / NBRC 6347 / NRRL 1970) TaxID=306901 RepID=Q2HAQ8_CHAGB|nr:uncharacterized protein CHGG_02696 [Chaetomium globosum CBS 148.51]EAQ90761.1 predicted protein [Chaetomium globosum CBS 148.51]
MEVGQLINLADDDVDGPRDGQIPDCEAQVDGARASEPASHPVRSWQENEDIANLTANLFNDNDDLHYVSSRYYSTDDLSQPPTEASATEAIATPSPSTRKRPRQKSLAIRPTQNKRKKTAPKKEDCKLVFSREITTRVMQLFLDETRAGALKDTKASFQKPAMERILKAMEAEFPRFTWAVDKVRAKYKNERRRYRMLLTLLAISGVNFSHETGLPSAPDNVWKSFLKKYPKANWLRTTSIGDRDVYAEVYHNEKASGRHIKEARQLVGPGRVLDDPDIDVDDFSAVEDSSGDTDTDDPDDNTDDEDNIEAVAAPRTPVPRGAARPRRSREPGVMAVADSIGRLAESNTTSTTRVVTELAGADDIRMALKDFQEGFAGSLDGDEISTVPRANPAIAAIALTKTTPSSPSPLAL